MEFTRETTAFLRRLLLGEELIALGFVLVSCALGGSIWYEHTLATALSARVDTLSGELASTTALLQLAIADATSTLGSALQQQNQHVAEQLGGFQNQVGSITGTVSNLQKLAATDKQLLAKYSKVFFLNENYAPERLTDLPTEYKYTATKTLQLIPQVALYLSNMLNQAKINGVPLFVQSAYRSFSAQESLKGQYTVTYGAGTSNQFSADQGYSEHQLGTTVDLITTGTGGSLSGFDRTPAYQWMLDNGYKYGFVLSYPKNNTYYIFEPWHWRFVGVQLATYLHNNSKNFYDMDQRDIDTYLISIFD